MKKHPYPLVVVVWRDAVRRDSDESVVDMTADIGCDVVTVGWLLKDAPDGLRIVSEYTIGDQGNVRARWDIPRAMIKSCHEVSARQKKPKETPQ